MTVLNLKRGEQAEVVKINAAGAEGARLSALGLKTGTRVRVLSYSLFKSSVLLGFGAVRLSVRSSLAERIEVKR